MPIGLYVTPLQVVLCRGMRELGPIHLWGLHRATNIVRRTDPCTHALQVLKPGDKGFRYHASIPQAARLDYLKRPDNAVSVDPETLKSRANKLGKVGKKIQTLNKKYTNAGSKAAKVSIEGRGM